MQRFFNLAARKPNAGDAGQGGFGQKGKEYEIDGRRYVEERPISEGGFSYVVQVRDTEDGQTYALKKILCQDEEGFLLAQREVEILADLPAHKNIVGYFGHAIEERKGRSGTREFQILLELCPGGHLLNYLDRHKGTIPEAKLVKAFTDVAEAIFCLHSHSPPIQHRDLKLENVLRGRDGFWKVVDFGSWSNEPVDLSAVPAKQLAALGEELQSHTTMMYRPPEMVDVHQRFPITCAVDIWMLGCVLYSLMYNRHPFQEAAVLAIRNANYVIPARKPAASAKLVDLLIWLLAHDPRHRPSARKLVTTLWQWADITNLELPEAVLERRTKLLSAGRSAFDARPERRLPAEAAGKAVALAPPPRGKAGQMSVAPAATASVEAVAAAAAAMTPWVAFDEGVPAAAGAPAAATAAESLQEDWGFDGFQSASGGSTVLQTALPESQTKVPANVAHAAVSEVEARSAAEDAPAVTSETAEAEATASAESGAPAEAPIDEDTPAAEEDSGIFVEPCAEAPSDLAPQTAALDTAAVVDSPIETDAHAAETSAPGEIERTTAAEALSPAEADLPEIEARAEVPVDNSAAPAESACLDVEASVVDCGVEEPGNAREDPTHAAETSTSATVPGARDAEVATETDVLATPLAEADEIVE